MARIQTIVSAKVETYQDNGQTIATVYWRDTNGQYGATTGSPTNAHMAALLKRASLSTHAEVQ